MISKKEYTKARAIVNEYEKKVLNTPSNHRFNILIETGEILPNAQNLIKRSDITKDIRLFYELGYKRNANLVISEGNWVRTGKFKEVKDPVEFRDKDNLLDNPEYIKHHNFVVTI